MADLKRELKIRGLNVTGNKNELVERLQSALIGKFQYDTLDTNKIVFDFKLIVFQQRVMFSMTPQFLRNC